jgi:hypothetical protein
MAAKEVKFSVEARDKMLRGIDIRSWQPNLVYLLRSLISGT